MSDNPSIKVSVIVATRNRSDLLPRCLAAIEKQTLRQWECVVVDDGSSAEHLAQYESIFSQLDGRFRWLRPPGPACPGTSPAAGRNRGIRATTAPIVAFCDDDDWWIADDHLEQAVRCMEKTGADLYIGNMRGEGDGKVKIPEWFPDSPWLRAGPFIEGSDGVRSVTPEALARTMRHHYPHPNCIVAKRSLVEGAGMFWEKQRHGEDMEFSLRMGDAAESILFRDKPVVAFGLPTGKKSSFHDSTRIDHRLVVAMGMLHVASLARRRCFRKTALSIHAHLNQELANLVSKEGRRKTAAGFAFRGWVSYPTAGGFVRWIKHAAAAVR